MVKTSKILDLPQGLAGEFLFNEPLSGHTSFRIGGPASLLAIPYGEQSLVELLVRIKRQKLNYYILGNGSNLLAQDRGFKGVVIKITKGFKKLSRDKNRLTVDSGYSLPALVDYCAKEGLAGLEWAVGIPGSLGGALVMNAGAYGGQMADSVKKVWGFTPDGKKLKLSPKQINFAYRQAHYPKGFVITGAELELKPGRRSTIEKAMRLYFSKRKKNQPLSLPSAGCIFKNPPGRFGQAADRGGRNEGPEAGRGGGLGQTRQFHRQPGRGQGGRSAGPDKKGPKPDPQKSGGQAHTRGQGPGKINEVLF